MPSSILIVDDDVMVLEALSGMIKIRLDHVRVDLCTAATDALARIGEVDYDAIVSDIKMPGMDGLTLMQKVLERRPATPTLLITGHGDLDLGVHALKSGAYAFIPKPIDRDYFIAWLTRAIQLRQLSRVVEQQNHMLERTVQERTGELERANQELKAALASEREARNDAEATLRRLSDSEERLRILIEGVGDYAIFMLDARGHVNSWNTGAERITGYRAEEILGKDHVCLYPEEDRRHGRSARDLQAAAAAAAADTPYERDEWRLRKDGTRFIANIVVTVLRDGRDRLRGYAVVMRDITERRRAEEALQESEYRYRSLFDSIDEGFCIIEMMFDERDKPVDYRFLQVSPSFEKQTGLKDAQGKRMRELAPRHEEHWFEMYGNIALTGEPARVQNFAAQLHRWYDVYAFRFGAPANRRVAILFNDITERKQAEAAVRRRAAQFETLLNQAPLGVYLVDGDFRIRQVNPIAQSVFEPIPDLIGRNFDEVLHILWPQAYADEVVAIFRHTLDTGESYVVPERIEERRDRAVREFYEWQIHRIPLPEGRYGVVCYFRDISAQVQAREAIAESEERFRTLADHMSQFAWTADATGWIYWYNRRWFEYTGTTLEEMQGGGWKEAHHPDHVDRVIAKWQRAHVTGELWEDTFPLRGKDGNYRWFLSRAVPIRDAEGKIIRWFGTNTDVTEQREAQEALRESQARLQFTLDSAQVGDWDLDVIHDTARRSLRHDQAFGYNEPVQEWGFEIFIRHVHPEDRADIERQFRDAVTQQQNWHFECRVIWPAGGIHWIAAHGSMYRTLEGEATRMLGIVVNITARKEAEQEIVRLLVDARQRELELREKQDQLVQAGKLASIGELATGVAHEINNPLNNIGLIVGNLMDRCAARRIDAAVMIADLRKVLVQVSRASKIITQVRTFGRASGAERQPLAIHDVMQSALDLVREQFRLKDIEIALNLDGSNPMVLGNRLQLEQVFVNLFTNARDGMEDAAEKSLSLSTVMRADRVQVRIADTGMGISPDVLPRIFDPFFTTKDVGRGTGLGLSISYSIIKEHHGTITADSRAGVGTTFSIELPLAGC